MDKTEDCGSSDTGSTPVGCTFLEECLEWLIGQLSKSLGGASLTGVRIPPPPLRASIVEWIQRWFPEPLVQVRFLLGALI